MRSTRFIVSMFLLMTAAAAKPCSVIDGHAIIAIILSALIFPSAAFSYLLDICAAHEKARRQGE